MKEAIHKVLNKKGFSLIEIVIAMAILLVLMAMVMDTFGVIFRQGTKETKTVGSQIDAIVGLETMRLDIEHAGFGLPWSFPPDISITYSEAEGSPASTYNDAPNVPRAIMTGNDVGYNKSDYLVLRGTAVGGNETSQKWTYIKTGEAPKRWEKDGLDFEKDERVIVIKPRQDVAKDNELVVSGDAFYTKYSKDAFPSGFSPSKPSEVYLIYGVDPDTDLRMPFNRADYYISRPSSNMPSSCAPNTGILYKATVNHGGGGLSYMPVLDCVADMQVIFRLDEDGNGIPDKNSNNITHLTSKQIREEVKEVRVYILTHEGGKDDYFVYPNKEVTVGEFDLGRVFNLESTIGQGWQRYRWKVHTIVLKPKNLFK